MNSPKTPKQLQDALLHIPDTQGSRDQRRLAIQRVGIKDLRYPLTLRIGTVGHPQASELAHTVANWALDVALPADRKGTHMSRFIAWLESLKAPLDADGLRDRMAEMLERLDAQEGRVEARFPFFLRKRAPVSGLESLLEYEGGFIAEARFPAHAPESPQASANSAPIRIWARVVVPVKTLCPCSKEISDYGAHNQRSHVTMHLELREAVDWTELVRFAEDQASSELWPMLKRSDEKWVTERAYENPKFVEDLVRDVALALNADARIGAYRVEVENFESIHAHNAYAQIVRD